MINRIASSAKHLSAAALFSLVLSGAALAQSATLTPARMAVLQALINRYIQEGAQITQNHDGVVVTPASSINHPENDGRFAHTNVKLFFPFNAPVPVAANPQPLAPPSPGLGFETPASLACVYKIVAVTAGCNPNVVTANSPYGSRAVAIVDAYHAPNARADLAVYAAQFGLPAVTETNLVIWYCGVTLASCNQTTPPAYNSGWEGEIHLDLQMVKALAPQAKLFLVEAKTNSYNNLMVAVDKAAQLVAAQGGGQVSLSWGGAEFSTQTNYDARFTGTNVVFFASSGDEPSVSWPSSSPRVVSVGGTSLSRNPTSLNLVGHSTWVEAGTGPSTIYPRPGFQNVIAGIVGNHRATPDVSAVANPNTGVWVYISNQGGWNVFGGTSAASPVMAAIINAQAYFPASTTAFLNENYPLIGNPSYFPDITVGTCGPYTGYWAATGWDWCGGIGTIRY